MQELSAGNIAASHCGGMIKEQILQRINTEADRLVSVENYRFDAQSEMVLTSSVLKEN